VFLAAILPQFVSRQAGHVPAQILVLGLLFAAIAVAPTPSGPLPLERYARGSLARLGDWNA
jgi:hypothetical protein